MISTDTALTPYDNDEYQDEMIADLFSASNFEEVDKEGNGRSSSSKHLAKAVEGAIDPIDEDIQNMVRQDVRRMMQKIKSEHRHKKSKQKEEKAAKESKDHSLKAEMSLEKYGEAQDELFRKIKKEVIKKKKILSSRKKHSPIPEEQKIPRKKSFYKNRPLAEMAEYIDVTDLTEERFAMTGLPTSSTKATSSSSPSNQGASNKHTKDVPAYPESRSLAQERNLPTVDEEREDVESFTRPDVTQLPSEFTKESVPPREEPNEHKDAAPQNNDIEKVEKTVYETEQHEAVELVLLDNSRKLAQLEEENKRLKDTLHFLQQAAVDKEKYYAELAWFGKRNEDEVVRIRPNFWEERREDLGPELFQDFQADARRIADPDVGDWEHGFASGSLAMARLLLGLSHAVEDEKICAYHEAGKECTSDCVTCTVDEQRQRELEDFPVLDP